MLKVHESLQNREWLSKNELAVKKLLPETWTHVGNVRRNQLMLGLILLGIEILDMMDLQRALTALELNRILLIDGFSIRRNPVDLYQGKK